MKLVVIGIVFVILIALGSFYYLSQQPKTPDLSTPAQTNTEDKITIEDNQTINSDLVIGSDSAETVESNPNPYQEYSKATFNKNTDKKTRILFFYADWCPTCRPVDAEIKANLSAIPKDIVIIKVNYNDDYTDQDEKDLARRYGITYQHTFVRIDSKGNEVDKWNGGDFEKLLEYAKSATKAKSQPWETQ